MASFNKVFLIGNLTRDPELRYTPNQAAVTELGLATNRRYTTKEGETREEVTFIDVTVWNRQAENCCQYLKKGRSVHVEGYLKLDSWDDKTTGEKRSKLKVEAESVQFLGGREGGPGEGESAPAREPYRRPAEGRAPTNGSAPRPPSNPSAAAPRKPTPPPPPAADEDDDIPF